LAEVETERQQRGDSAISVGDNT